MLSDALKKLRKQFEMTQQEVADALQIDRSTYTYYEIGRTKPDFAALCKLARLYKVSLDDIARLAQGDHAGNTVVPIDAIDARVANKEDDADAFFLNKTRNFYTLSDDEKALIFLFRSAENKKKIFETVQVLSEEDNIRGEHPEN